MHVDQAVDLTEVLADVDRPPPPMRLPGASPRIRVETSPLLRRAVPGPLAVKWATGRAHAYWERDAGLRARAHATMEAVLTGTRRAHEVDELARAHVVENQIRDELFWQPWWPLLVDDASMENGRRAVASGRGMIFSTAHLSTFFSGGEIAPRLGRRPYMISGGWFFEKPRPGYWGRRVARWYQHQRRYDGRFVRVQGSFPVARALLERGEMLMMAFDMPGSRETRFLGKPVMLAAGTARLATMTDALVVPMRPMRVGHRTRMHIAEAVDPRDFADLDELHETLAAIHEAWILAAPEGLEDPRRPGAWEDGATGTAWVRPEQPVGTR